jgi:hypothetical protein
MKLKNIRGGDERYGKPKKKESNRNTKQWKATPGD